MRLAAAAFVVAALGSAAAAPLDELGLGPDPDHASMWLGPQRLLTRVHVTARDAGEFTHVEVRLTIGRTRTHQAVVPFELSPEIRLVGLSITAGGRIDAARVEPQDTAIHTFVEAHSEHAPALLVHDHDRLRLGVYVFDAPVVATLELELPHGVVFDVDPGHHVIERFEIDLDGRPIHAGPVSSVTTIDCTTAVAAPRRAAPTALDATTAFVVAETGVRARPPANATRFRMTHRPEGMHWLSETNLVATIDAHSAPLSDCLALGAAWRAVEGDPTYDEPAVIVTIEAGAVVDVRVDGVALAAERTCIATEVMTWTFADAGHRKTLRAPIPDRDNFDLN